MEDIDEKERLKGDKKMPTGELLKRTLVYIKPQLPKFIISFILIFSHVGMDILLPFITSRITNSLTEVPIAVRTAIYLSVAYLAISIVDNFFYYVESMILQKAGQDTVLTLREDVFRHIESMSQNQFTEMPVGSLVTRVTSYTQSLSDLFTNVLVSVVRNIVMVVGVYAVMYFIDVKLSLIMLIPVTVIFVSSLVFSKIVGKIFRSERKSISELNAFMSENLSGMKITQIFNREEKKLAEFDEKNENLRHSRFHVVLAFGVYRPLVTFINIASIALVFLFGVKAGLDAAAIVAFYLYVGRFFSPIQQLADQLNNIQKALTASERLFNLMDVAPEVRDKPDAIAVDKFEGRIEFRNVWFAYNAEDWILKDVSFVIEPRQTCAFVGATGAGKTTILSLIVRNYEIQKGQILIDGIDIANIQIKSLRRAIGQMLQDVFLFSGTVKSNISLHDDTIPDDEIKEACRYIGADTFIEKMPKQYDEEIIERGENFSQGQRQLLSFARTVLHKPQILILDEATANIDTETEVLIQQSLEKMRNIGTMLVVAHRLSTIQHADQIIVLQNGEIIERGNHQELLAQHGYYWKLYRLQFEQ